MTFTAWLHAMQPHARPSRLTSPSRGGTLPLLVGTAAASLAALVAGQVLTHPLSDLSAYGCWSVPDNASPCTSDGGPTLQDQLQELASSVLPDDDRRAALARQATRPRSPGTAAFRP